ncbi:hypothetical protein FYJ91_03110 [Sphingomonas montanisoli]|uniref:Type II methyltransferase M.Eco57I C-terminal domain-containing protein n=1 Tax=Sphingomonas montanisoli TaxID=2606412 RepID=A0A5D9CBN3_9SPHN|nr:hypothetical protein FYJ91_03110 [Sphingomonas montanisoli]
MMRQITGWFLQGIGFDEAPPSLVELRETSRRVILTRDELMSASKWEPLLQGKRHDANPGWVTLETLASFRRGVATGANGFFLLSRDRLDALGISVERCLPCVGRASDVRGLIYRPSEFEAAAAAGGKLFLLNLKDPLTDEEKRYVRIGEDQSLTKRFLLANRKPWYSMEQRPVAPIWAAVFGRGDLKFVFNEASARTLTNFHCLYPTNPNPVFHQALTMCLNSTLVRETSKLHGRVYGGGLNKFEPNDLKSIQVPDLNLTPKSLILEMSKLLFALDAQPQDSSLKERADELCAQAAREASPS